VWPIAYTFSNSFSLFQTFFTPFLLLLYLINVKYFIREKSATYLDDDNTPQDGLPTLIANLWAIYRLCLFDDSFLRDDYEPSIDMNTFLEIFLYSIAGNATGVLSIPAYLASFVTPQIFIAIVFQQLYGAKTLEIILNMYELFVNYFSNIFIIWLYIMTNLLTVT